MVKLRVKYKKSAIRQNIKRILEGYNKENSQKLLIELERALKDYPEDIEFITEIFQLIINKMKEIYVEGVNLKALVQRKEGEIEGLKNNLQAHEGHPTLFNPKEGIFKWRNTDGDLIIAPIAKPVLKAIYNDTIDNYKMGEKNDGAIIFKKEFYEWKEGDFPILTGYLSDLKESVKKAISDGKINIEEEKESIERIDFYIEKIRKNHPNKDDFSDIEKVCEFLIKHEGEWVTAIMIKKYAGFQRRQQTHYNLKLLYEADLIEKSDDGRECRLKPIDGN